MDTLQAQRAQENFIKGFRDFRQGNYARAREHFQVVLTLDPEHQEARRYLTLSKFKFDELIKRQLQQGRIYFENKNYRLCRASFESALIMLHQNQNDPSYKDAKKFFEACDLALGGR
jgi:tetratricopeptide (TPR) repeat protein